MSLRQTYRTYKSLVRKGILDALYDCALIRRICDHWVLVDNLNNRSVVIDLGANKGAFSNHMIRSFQCKVYAVEPDLELYNKLLQDGIDVFNYAIASANGSIEFYVSTNCEASSVLPNFEAVWGLREKYLVAGITLSTFMQRIHLDDKIIDVLKVDIEGGELALIESLRADDVRNIKQITVEFHDWLNNDLHAGTLAAIDKLVSLGFVAYTDAPHHNTAVEVLFINKELCVLSTKQRLSLWAFNRLAYLNYN